MASKKSGKTKKDTDEQRRPARRTAVEVATLDVFGVDDAGVYHPPSRARYEQWELIHAERRRLTLRLAAIVEELSQHIPSSSNDSLPKLRRDDSERLCALFRALPITWRQHVGRLEEEEAG